MHKVVILLSTILLLVVILLIVALCLGNGSVEPTWITTEQRQRIPFSFPVYLPPPELFEFPSLDAIAPILPAPQILSGSAGFGRQVFVHQKGFVAIQEGSTLRMYQIVDSIVKIQDIALPTHIGNEDAVLCYGTFLPSLGLVDEFFYLALAFGVTSTDFPGELFARQVHIYSCKSGTTLWQPSVVIQHPYFVRTSATLIPPYVGCFGNRMQGVLDDNNPQSVRLSLYINSTEWEDLNEGRPQPSQGGTVFWYVLFNNAFEPDFRLHVAIQDAKLAVISKDPDTEPPFPALAEIDYYMRGFGSSFYVQSGNQAGNLLAVANLTNQDTVDNKCDTVENPFALRGYVQIYTVGTVPTESPWRQEFAICKSGSQSGFNQQIYVNRIVPVSLENGFGASVLLLNNILLVRQGALLESFNLASGGGAPPVGAVPWGSLDVTTVGLSSEDTFPGPTQNVPLFTLNGMLGIASWTQLPNVNTIGLFNTHTTNLPGVSPTDNLFVNFGEPLAVIGLGESSGSSLDALTGFGQWIYTWRSSNSTRVWLLVNDALGNRVFLYNLLAD